MGTSTTGVTGRFRALARLAVALGFAATLLAGQAVVFDRSAIAKPCTNPDTAICLFEMEAGG